LSKIDECVTVDNESFNLFSYEVPGFIMHGYHHLERFEYDMLPKYIYRVKDVYVERKYAWFTVKTPLLWFTTS